MSDFFDRNAATWDAVAYRVERSQKIAAKILSEIKISRNSSALDFGCGTGLLGFNFMDSVREMTFADTSKGMLSKIDEKANKQGQKNYKVINLTSETITENYDIIMSLLALHHIPDFESSVRNLLRHVSKNGYICLSDLDIEDGSFHSPEIVPHNGIDRKVLIKLITDSDCEISYCDAVHINEKNINGEKKEFPMFLIIGKRR